MSPAHPRGGTADLLFEIGTEELPPKALHTLSRELGGGIVKGLAEHGLAFDQDVRLFASPRRLAVWVKALSLVQPDTVIERRGPPLSKAYDERGRPTRAAEGFAQTCGVEVARLERLETDKGAWLVYRQQQAGRATRELVPGVLQQALDRLPIPKRMRWNALTFEFVRPVHWAVLLLGGEVIDCEILGVCTGRETRGHRFHHPGPIALADAAAYGPLLADRGRVIADFQQRREAIYRQVVEAAGALGGEALVEETLLDEVTGLVEWPVALVGTFDRRFLEVPQEAVISAMQVHQKCFAVTEPTGRLMPYFITISNIDSRDPASVRAGFERVIRPRLADADFFWNRDRRQPLASHLERLGAVVFQARLGTLLDKSQRLIELAKALATHTGAGPAAAGRAAQLSKCDLLTRMVEEFPELQGTMGRYYALHDGEPPETADAIGEQYRPRFAGDELPRTAGGQALALADKLDTLVGVFAIGQAPTGDKDPFALRRAALGVVRILIERRIDVDLRALIEPAVAVYREQDRDLCPPGLDTQIMEFVTGRLRVYFTSQGFGHDEVNAVLATGTTHLMDIDGRLRALAVFRKLPDAESLTGANKRIKNLLRQVEGRVPEHIDSGLFSEAEEAALAARVEALSTDIMPLLASRDYEHALTRLAQLRETVDNFFDRVMVMADDKRVRDNRLALLHAVMVLFTKIADLSALQ